MTALATENPPIRGRFAPSPTGPLHLGSLLAALGSYLHARTQGGQWWVRIEDVDRDREMPGAAQSQLETLQRFGLEWDGDVLRQSQRGALYQAALDRLLTSGLAFECHCSRSDLAESHGLHRQCLAHVKRLQPAFRFRVATGCRVDFQDEVLGAQSQRVDMAVGDFVLKRADGHWAYQLAVVVDDAAQGITEVVRGADLADSTARQILLQKALGLATPRYLHLPLLLDENGRKLSKSLAALPLDSADPLPALRWVWQALGQPAAIVAAARSPQQLLHLALANFDASLIPRQPSALHNRIFQHPA